jgi:transposase-like protein
MSEKDLVQRFKLIEKMRLVAESWHLRGENLGSFLRRNGISSPELLAWRSQMKDGLEEGLPVVRSEKKRYEAKIKRLEEEVRQLRVLNDLQKKAQILLEQEEARNTAKSLEKKSSRSPKKGSAKG